jgi:hypothetical protein
VRPVLAKSRILCEMLLALGFLFMSAYYCFIFYVFVTLQYREVGSGALNI